MQSVAAAYLLRWQVNHASSLHLYPSSEWLSISRSMHGPPKYHQYVHNKDRPDKAYTTEWAKKSEWLMLPVDGYMSLLHLTILDLFFERRKGVFWLESDGIFAWSVGNGASIIHMYKELPVDPNYGAQFVVISRGYEDDEDHGEWFLHRKVC